MPKGRFRHSWTKKFFLLPTWWAIFKISFKVIFVRKNSQIIFEKLNQTLSTCRVKIRMCMGFLCILVKLLKFKKICLTQMFAVLLWIYWIKAIDCILTTTIQKQSYFYIFMIIKHMQLALLVLTRDLCKQFWCPLHSTKNSIFQSFSILIYISVCLFVCFGYLFSVFDIGVHLH